MTKKPPKASRTSILMQLSQALDHYRAEGIHKGRKNLADFIDVSATEADEAAPWKLLQNKEEKRRHLRFQEILPVTYSVSPSLKLRRPPKTTITERKLELPEWFEEIAATREQMLNTSSQMQMIIHLQSLDEELIYFIAFAAAKASKKKLPAVSRKTVISGTGMEFPTALSHSPGEIFFIVFFLPTAPYSPLKLVAEVVRSSVRYPREGYRTPVKFIDISREDQQQLINFIGRRQRQQHLSKAYKIDT